MAASTDSHAAVATGEVRPATAADADAVAAFLHKEVSARISPARWRVLWEINWTDRPDFGHLLEVDGSVVGYLGALMSERTIAGRREILCNLTTWFVSPAHRKRGTGLRLLAPYLRDDWTATVFTASASGAPLFRKKGFETLDTGKLVFPLLANPGTLRLGSRVLTDLVQISKHLTAEDRLLLEDHVPFGCGTVLALGAKNYAFLILKRRVIRRIPLAEILYCSNPQLASAMFERIKLAALWSQRAVALVSDARLLGPVDLRHIRIPRLGLFRSSRLAADKIDGLYSELAVLPI